MPRFATDRRVFRALAALIVVIGAVALVRDTAAQGQDFAVFWSAARALLQGKSAYALAPGGMVFKYPPWVIPAFVPFALLPLAAAKWAWGTVEVLSLASVLLWCACAGARDGVLGLCALCFWGIWAVHALDGQVVLPILAALLWFWRSRGAWAAALLGFAASIKVFSAFALVGVRDRARSAGAWIAALALVGALSLPSISVERGPAALARAWVRASSSGGALLSVGKIRGRENESFTALALRLAHVRGDHAGADITVALVLGAALCLVWAWAARPLREEAAWCGWIALIPLFHPLAWVHLFVLVFPVTVLSLESAIRSRRRAFVALACAGLVFQTLLTGKTLGSAGVMLELASVKSWGTVLSLLALVLSSRTPVRAGARA